MYRKTTLERKGFSVIVSNAKEVTYGNYDITVSELIVCQHEVYNKAVNSYMVFCTTCEL